MISYTALHVQLSFVPKASTKYAAMIEFSARLPHEEEALPLMTMELKGEGRYPQLLFDRPVAFLPAVPVGVTSQTQFRILNDGCAYVFECALEMFGASLHNCTSALNTWTQDLHSSGMTM